MSQEVRQITPVRTASFSCAFVARALIAIIFVVGLGASGCSRPQVPSLTGNGMFHDISQCRKGMSPNEVRGLMGGGYQNVMEEGIRGMDGGNYTWVYPEGQVYFNYDGVTRVVPNN